MLLSLYRAILLHSGWLLRLIVRQRLMRGLEERGHEQERWGDSTLPRPTGHLIWIHAASIGEMRSILPLARHLLDKNADLTCLLTTVTVTAAKLVRQMNNPRIIHQYAPLDHPGWVEKFLKHWAPDAAIWVESELWPNSLGALAKNGTPIMMVNGRLSERSAKRWRLLPRTIRTMMGWFDSCLAQSDEDAARLKALGAQKVTVVGNMKYSGITLPVDQHALEAMMLQVGARPTVLFASTHDGEEMIIAQTLAKLRETHPELLGIIMPRHPVRGEVVSQMMTKAGFNTVRRSLLEVAADDTQIYIADTLGEPGLFYRLCRIVFMGNSLINTPGGGHNPVEPAQLGCAVVYGPYIHNFTEIANDLRQCRAAVRVENEKELFGALDRLLTDPTRAAAMGRTAQTFMADQNGVLGRAILHLRPSLLKASLSA